MKKTEKLQRVYNLSGNKENNTIESNDINVLLNVMGKTVSINVNLSSKEGTVTVKALDGTPLAFAKDKGGTVKALDGTPLAFAKDKGGNIKALDGNPTI
jgi:hypothetical protein